MSKSRKAQAMQTEIENHLFDPIINVARKLLQNQQQDTFKVLLEKLHYIAGKTNEINSKGYIIQPQVVTPHSPTHHCINDLFKQAKEKYAMDPERLNEIRFKQACFLEHMKQYKPALDMLDSLAKHAQAPLRWCAMNSRTWLLRDRGLFPEALRSAQELIDAYGTLTREEAPSHRRLLDAERLKAGTLYLMGQSPAVSLKVSVATMHATQFSKTRPKPKHVTVPEAQDGRRISPLVQQLFQ